MVCFWLINSGSNRIAYYVRCCCGKLFAINVFNYEAKSSPKGVADELAPTYERTILIVILVVAFSPNSHIARAH